LNEEKLCQLLANQTRAREKALQQTVTAKPQRVVAAQVQHQISSLKKMVAAVVQTFALQVQMHLASLVQRVLSSKSALQKLMATHQSVLHTETAMTALLAKTAADTRAVQSVLHMETAKTLAVQSALLTETAMTAAHVGETVRLMAARVLQQVAVTLAR
jgi:hypothetical protein